MNSFTGNKVWKHFSKVKNCPDENNLLWKHQRRVFQYYFPMATLLTVGIDGCVYLVIHSVAVCVLVSAWNLMALSIFPDRHSCVLQRLVPLHSSRCLPEAGPHSPGPCSVNEPQVKWGRNKRAWQLLGRRLRKTMGTIPLTWFHLLLNCKNKNTGSMPKFCMEATAREVSVRNTKKKEDRVNKTHESSAHFCSHTRTYTPSIEDVSVQ